MPSALSGTTTGLGYSQDALVLLSIAQYIRNLGYRATASMKRTPPWPFRWLSRPGWANMAGTPLRKLMLKVDIWLGYGARKSPHG